MCYERDYQSNFSVVNVKIHDLRMEKCDLGCYSTGCDYADKD